MAYITNADVIARLGSSVAAKYSADTGTTPDAALIDRIISESEGELNTALGTRVAVPVLSASSPLLFAVCQRFAMAMTIYWLAFRRPPIHEDWKRAYEDAKAWMEKFVNGEVDPPDGEDTGDAIATGWIEGDRFVP